MIVLGHILISNGPNDGGILGGTFTPQQDEFGEGRVAAKLELITAGGQIILEAEAAILLFAHYDITGTHLGGNKPAFVPISREAVIALRDEMHDTFPPRSAKIIKALAARL